MGEVVILVCPSHRLTNLWNVSIPPEYVFEKLDVTLYNDITKRAELLKERELTTRTIIIIDTEAENDVPITTLRDHAELIVIVCDIKNTVPHKIVAMWRSPSERSVKMIEKIN